MDSRFNLDEFFSKNRYLILAILSGLILVSLGFYLIKNVGLLGSTKVEVLTASTEAQGANSFVVVEISGEVENPGVYKLPQGTRIDDLLIASGGLSASADRVWVEKNINRAQKLLDGQKIYIQKLGGSAASVSNSSGGGVNSSLVNINTADVKTLDTLSGIGQVYAQSIIEHRPYSTIEDLTTKGVLPKSVFDKIKDKISVY